MSASLAVIAAIELAVALTLLFVRNVGLGDATMPFLSKLTILYIRSPQANYLPGTTKLLEEVSL
jgi:hypothetical protein